MDNESALSLIWHRPTFSHKEEVLDLIKTAEKYDLITPLKMMCVNLYDCPYIDLLSEKQQKEIINAFRPALVLAYTQQKQEQEVA
ncbi:hypothetical protein ACQU0X_31195 [Pseudovibrio ascidiaceicola]|uniref:hypothetical protein n=1 Tax=Pseudovibrio ascidiaceicola TaxID=285279 RepID=UPI003D36E6A4